MLLYFGEKRSQQQRGKTQTGEENEKSQKVVDRKGWKHGAEKRKQRNTEVGNQKGEEVWTTGEERGEIRAGKRCSEVPRPATGSAVRMINGSHPALLHLLLFLSFYYVLLMTSNLIPRFHFLWLSKSLINLSAVASHSGLGDVLKWGEFMLK